ncbi:hypothetical protein OG900_05960 [Streptomyces sp. NBC_00433]
MSGNTLPAGTQITLAFSARTGIVAVTGGTRYGQADTLLATAGFSRREDGTSTLAIADADAARRALTALTRLAADQDMTLTAGSRIWLGDTADRIAALLPGAWRSRIEVYAMPVWQQDLAECLWDAGDLIGAVRERTHPLRIGGHRPPGHGAFRGGQAGRRREATGQSARPHRSDRPVRRRPGRPALPDRARRSRPGGAGDHRSPAAACRQAVHHLRVQEVGDRLAHALSAEIARVLVRGSWPADEGTGIGAAILGQLDHARPEALWEDFRSFPQHGPELLDHLERTAKPLALAQRAVLPALREALRHGRRVHGQWLDTVRRMREGDSALAWTTYDQAAAQRTADAGPMLAARLGHGPALVDLAHRHPPADSRPFTPHTLPFSDQTRHAVRAAGFPNAPRAADRRPATTSRVQPR